MTLTEQITEAVAKVHEHFGIGEDEGPSPETYARAVVAVIPTADVSDEAILEALARAKYKVHPIKDSWLDPLPWDEVADAYRGGAQYLLPTVRALLDAQAAAHAAEVEALRAEGALARAALESEGARANKWLREREAARAEVEALRAEVEDLNARISGYAGLALRDLERAEAAEADRDAYRARIDAVRALAEPYTRTHINHDGSVSVGAGWSLARDVLAALDGA